MDIEHKIEKVPDGENWERLHKEVDTAYADWTPLKDQREHQKAQVLKRALLGEMAHETPSEADLLRRNNGPEDQWPDMACDLKVPDAMRPFLLMVLPLEELGAAEGSIEFDTIEIGQSWKTKRDGLWDEAFVHDYAEAGWPKSAGSSVRYVTPEEDREILRRLENMGLTAPGAEVPNVSHSLSEIIATEYPPEEWLVEGILRRGGAAIVYGPAGVGKTWFTHSLVLLAAEGRGCSVVDQESGIEVLKAGKREGLKVLLLDGEMTVPQIKDRVLILAEALELRKREDGSYPAFDNIEILAKADQDHRAEFVDLADSQWLPRIIEHCRKHEIELVVLDNLSTLSPSLEDENKATAWAPLNNLIIALKRENIATLIVHHAGKQGGYRGSSAIMTTLETAVELQRVEATEGASDARFKVAIEKSRAHGTPAIKGRVLRLKEGLWCVEVDEFGEGERVAGMVRSMRYATQTELGNALGMSQATVSRILRKAEAQGYLKAWETKECFRTAKELRETDESPLDV